MAVTAAPPRSTDQLAPASLFDPVNLEGSVSDRLRHIAARRPDHSAIKQGDQTYTYRALNELSDQIGAGLLMAVTEPGARIPLLFGSGEASVLLALFGVLKAGGAYTGLSPTFPLERNRAIWEDSDPVALLTDQQHAALALDITQDRRPVFVLEELLDAPPAVPPTPAIQPDQLAVLFYTSGSTGRPKGIERTHQQFLYRAARGQADFGIDTDARLIMSRFIGYAASGSVFAGLLNGATVYTLDLQTLSIPDLIAFWQREAITSASLPVSVFRQLADQVSGRLDLPHLRRVGLPGEALLKSDVDAFQRLFPTTCVLSHGFAASESGSGTRFIIRHDTVITTPRAPVGRPGENVEIFLWDENGQPVAPGEPGEIVIRSPYMSSGYWRSPELTRQHFLPDPEGGNRRMYRTGDLGRWLPDGNLMHLGRKDQMVKIRGFRIEPGEVELALQQAEPRVQWAVVAREREAGELELVAFGVPGVGVEFSPSEVRRSVAAILPPHMLPARFVRLEQWPLTASNKTDRQALKQMALPPAEPAETFVPPVGEQEQALAALWESVLKVKPIGRHDDFFDLGGNSLAAIALLARVARATGQTLPMTALFEAPTLAHMAALLRGESQAHKLPPAIVTFNPLGDRLPLFLLPELESSAMNLIKLVRHLGVERPVYGLQPRGFEDGQPPFVTIPEQAAYYVEAIRAVRPHGPYHLAGICYGGVVAYEVAHQLQAQGERVSALCLIDVPGVKPAGGGWRENLQRAWRGASRRLTLWRAFTRERLQQHVPLPPVPSKTSRRFYDEQGRLQPGRRLRYAQNLASLRYRPLPYHGRANLLRSGEFERNGQPRGWPSLLRGGIDLQIIPNITHHDLLGKGEHLQAMANWLAACLERADPRGRIPGEA
jgi:amino acid adenylation domain-containing protein